MHKGLKLTGPATTGPTVMARGRGGTECQIFVLYAHIRICIFVSYLYVYCICICLKGATVWQPTGRWWYLSIPKTGMTLIYHWAQSLLIWLSKKGAIWVLSFVLVDNKICMVKYNLGGLFGPKDSDSAYRGSLKKEPLQFKAWHSDKMQAIWGNGDD